MKNILIYEYITGGGIINEDLTHDLLYEAKLIPVSYTHLRAHET